MIVHHTKALITIFEEMFPLYKNVTNVYFDHGVNGIKILSAINPPLIFRYINKSNWELITLEYDEDKVRSTEDLRKALTLSQKQLTNERRRKK